jgi:predicted Zn finger-like uncharacterized protein
MVKDGRGPHRGSSLEDHAMNVTCPNCASVYRVDPAKVPEAGVRARCAVCSAVFAVSRQADQSRAPLAPTTPEPARQPTPEPKTEPVRPPAAAVQASRAAPEPMKNPFSAPTVSTPTVGAPAPAAASARPPAAPPSSPAPTTPSRPAAPQRPATPGGGRPGAGPASPPIAPPVTQSPPIAAPIPATPKAPATPASAAPVIAQPKAPPTSSPASPPATPVSKPAAGGRPANPFLSQDPALKARRLARALISDMVVYHPGKRQEGLRDGNLKDLFEEEIKKSWEEYAEQVGRELAESTAYFREALNEILAGGRQIF